MLVYLRTQVGDGHFRKLVTFPHLPEVGDVVRLDDGDDPTAKRAVVISREFWPAPYGEHDDGRVVIFIRGSFINEFTNPNNAKAWLVEKDWTEEE